MGKTSSTYRSAAFIGAVATWTEALDGAGAEVSTAEQQALDAIAIESVHFYMRETGKTWAEASLEVSRASWRAFDRRQAIEILRSVVPSFRQTA